MHPVPIIAAGTNQAGKPVTRGARHATKREKLHSGVLEGAKAVIEKHRSIVNVPHQM
jgi:hypothetical protein